MSFNALYSGSWRTAKQVHVLYSGSWRTAKAVWVHDGSAWRAAFIFSGALTVGNNGSGGYGHEALLSLGSLSPASIYGTPTEIVTGISYNVTDASKTVFRLAGGDVSGITQNSYFKDVYCVDSGVTLTSASASAFNNYGTGVEWKWDGDVFSLASNSGGTLYMQARPA